MSFEMSWRHLKYPDRSGGGRTSGRLCTPGNQAGHHSKGLWTVLLRKLGQIFVLYRLHWRFDCQPRGSWVGISSSICVLAVSWRFISFPVSSCGNSAPEQTLQELVFCPFYLALTPCPGLSQSLQEGHSKHLIPEASSPSLGCSFPEGIQEITLADHCTQTWRELWF